MARNQAPTPATTSPLAQNIKLGRALAGMTQTQLALALGLKEKQTVSNWERGIFKPSDENLAALCQVLDREWSWFYTDHAVDEPTTGAAA